MAQPPIGIAMRRCCSASATSDPVVGGEIENRIEEFQGDLFADRTSTATMCANQLQLWLASFAYVLICAVKRIGLRRPWLPSRIPVQPAAMAYRADPALFWPSATPRSNLAPRLSPSTPIRKRYGSRLQQAIERRSSSRVTCSAPGALTT